MEATKQILTDLIRSYPVLMEIETAIDQAFCALRECYEGKGKVLICGNGGSAADSEHIVGELMKGFLKQRKLDAAERSRFARLGSEYEQLTDHLQQALPAISLVNQSALNTAFANDVEADMIFGQQVYAYSESGRDALIAMSTSGNSANVVNAVKVAKAIGTASISITGKNGGILKQLSDVWIPIPADETYRIQELTLPVYHALCAMLEEHFYG